MDYAQRKRAAADFAKRWEGRGYEKGETALFWTDFLRDVVGVQNVSEECRFEQRTRDGGFIDAWLPERGVIIEQKSAGVDLDKPEVRQGREVTPYQQALAYAEQMPLNQQPRIVIVCNFETFRIHDRDKADPEHDFVEVPLSRLADDVALFGFFESADTFRSVREREVSIAAGELIGKLHTALSAQYVDPDSEESQHALNVLCVRLVFCLYAEDSGLFGKDIFLDYLRQVDARHMRRALIDLFEVLDTPLDERDPYLDEDLKRFPYVNGGLFRGQVEIPNFTDDIRLLLLLEVSQKTDWSEISPTIFGGVFESTLNPETRRRGGMHYTTPEAIHKAIDPLFLDGLRADYRAIKEDASLGDRERRRRLLAFQDRIASLTFFDPACGSGNFLTETYLCLRRLENRVLADLMNIRGADRTKRQFVENQTAMDFVDADTGDSVGVKVSIAQFFGIEINDFAVRVAKTALWIAELQANQESEYVISRAIEDLPLRDSANIVCANALRTDWSEVLPGERCDYIMGNPPFIGYSNLSSSQKEERQDIFGKSGGVLDYVTCWYKKAADYTRGFHTRCAFVSTNSICQGQQVEPLWRPLFEDGIHIDFAWKTFVWNSEASDEAHVHVIIIGFSRENVAPKILYESDGSYSSVGNINGYLAGAKDSFVSRRSRPLCQVSEMVAGGKPTDGGFLLLDQDEKTSLVAEEPGSEKWIRPFSMGVEFINGKPRYCLWLVGITPKELSSMPKVRQRVEGVRSFRLSSKKEATRRKADAPWLFDEVRPPKGESYIAVPKVSSGRRKYVPMGFVRNGMIPGDMLFSVSDAGLWEFGLLMSQFHNAWMRTVAGRLKSDYRYTNTIVYNNFVWPGIATDTLDVPVEEVVSVDIRKRVESCAQAVLDARALYPDSTLADMYDPDNEWMFPELTKAHRDLDAAVEAAYGVDFNGDEEKIVAHLFKLYAELTEGE